MLCDDRRSDSRRTLPNMKRIQSRRPAYQKEKAGLRKISVSGVCKKQHLRLAQILPLQTSIEENRRGGIIHKICLSCFMALYNPSLLY
jgi:hypothetical protein